MENDTHSSGKNKDDENKNLKRSNTKRKEKLYSGIAMAGATGLRRSARIQKQTPSHAIERKSETVDKQTTPCPLRRSLRLNHASLNSLGSMEIDKRSGSSGMKQKKAKNEKTVKQLTVEAKEVIEEKMVNIADHDEECNRMDKFPPHDDIISRGKVEGLDEFSKRNQEEDRDLVAASPSVSKSVKESLQNNGLVKSLNPGQKDSLAEEANESEDTVLVEVSIRGNCLFLPSDNCTAKERADTSVSNSVKEPSKNDVGMKLSPENGKNSFVEEENESEGGDCMEIVGNFSLAQSKNNNSAEEMSGCPERAQMGRCLEDTLQRNSTSNGHLVSDSVNSEWGKELTPSKKKRNIMDVNSDATAMVSNDITCQIDNFAETCGTLLKRRRYVLSSIAVNFVCCPVAAMLSDRSSHEAHVMVPIEKTQLLPSKEFIPSSQGSSNFSHEAQVMLPIEKTQLLPSKEFIPSSQGPSNFPHEAQVMVPIEKTQLLPSKEFIPSSQGPSNFPHEAQVMVPIEKTQLLPSKEFIPSSQGPSNFPHEAQVMVPIEKTQLLPSKEFIPSSQGPSNFPHEAQVMLPIEKTQLLPSKESIPSSQGPSNFPSGLGIERHPSIAYNISNHIVRTPVQTIEVSNQSVAQQVSNSGHYPLTNTLQILPWHHDDPFQMELEKICKETGEIINSHENMKLRLKSECEKEIEKAVTQIRRQYDNKIQEIEIELLHKKSYLDKNHNTVLRNKLLADTFRYKCLDPNVSDTLRMQQDSSFVQRLFLLSRQQNIQRKPVAGQSSSMSPSANLHSISVAVAGQSSSGPLAANLHSTSITASLQTTPPPVQAAHRGCTFH
ncbi:helicase protein MOM1-like isoform X1 [Quillaja saponaria]|uniref:Helicase protein MOM1-like isoform X1 n=1 Tax=Quillaja saponaria TaxID=32244 RepID=A0AAD7KZ69_QUISA|nr:helicase protein MOM1-like isoform X1 [Quillaja saponaria]